MSLQIINATILGTIFLVNLLWTVYSYRPDLKIQQNEQTQPKSIQNLISDQQKQNNNIELSIIKKSNKDDKLIESKKRKYKKIQKSMRKEDPRKKYMMSQLSYRRWFLNRKILAKQNYIEIINQQNSLFDSNISMEPSQIEVQQNLNLNQSSKYSLENIYNPFILQNLESQFQQK